VDPNAGRLEASGDHRLFEPQQDVVACSVLVVAKVVVEAELVNATGFEQGDGFLGPANLVPPFGSRPLVIEEDLHARILEKGATTCYFEVDHGARRLPPQLPPTTWLAGSLDEGKDT
jgi:hypothetical protein